MIGPSLSYVEFDGPPATDPYIPRHSTVDTEMNLRSIEREWRIALTRVQNQAFVDQNAGWAPSVYLGLANEQRHYSLHENAADIAALFLKRYPTAAMRTWLEKQAAALSTD